MRHREPKVSPFTRSITHVRRSSVLTPSPEWQLPGYGRAPVNPRGLSHQSNPQPAGSSTAPTIRNEPPRPSYSTVATGGQQYNPSSARGTQRASRARASSRSRRPYTARGASHRSTPLFPNSPSKAALITGDKKPTGESHNIYACWSTY